jgi:hypothetical protein
MNAPRNAQYRFLATHRIAGSLGAVVEGVDLSADLRTMCWRKSVPRCSTTA